MFGPTKKYSVEYPIEDRRKQKEFSGVTFSEFKKSAARKELHRNILECNIEAANYWGAEFVSSGHLLDIWEVLILIYGKNIHIANPYLCLFLNKKYDDFRNAMARLGSKEDYHARNRKDVRTTISSIITVVAMSRKSNPVTPIKVDTTHFDLEKMSNQLEADNMEYSKGIYSQKDDPRELFIAFNEFCYNINKKVRNCHKACYWIEWILEYIAYCTRKKSPCLCKTREILSVGEQFRKEPIWMIWEACRTQAKRNCDLNVSRCIDGLFDIFCIRFTKAAAKRRRYLLYFVCQLLCTSSDVLQKEIVSNKSLLEDVISRSDMVYKQVKNSEKPIQKKTLF